MIKPLTLAIVITSLLLVWSAPALARVYEATDISKTCGIGKVIERKNKITGEMHPCLVTDCFRTSTGYGNECGPNDDDTRYRQTVTCTDEKKPKEGCKTCTLPPQLDVTLLDDSKAKPEDVQKILAKIQKKTKGSDGSKRFEFHFLCKDFTNLFIKLAQEEGILAHPLTFHCEFAPEINHAISYVRMADGSLVVVEPQAAPGPDSFFTIPAPPSGTYAEDAIADKIRDWVCPAPPPKFGGAPAFNANNEVEVGEGLFDIRDRDPKRCYERLRDNLPEVLACVGPDVLDQCQSCCQDTVESYNYGANIVTFATQFKKFRDDCRKSCEDARTLQPPAQTP